MKHFEESGSSSIFQFGSYFIRLVRKYEAQEKTEDFARIGPRIKHHGSTGTGRRKVVETKRN